MSGSAGVAARPAAVDTDPVRGGVGIAGVAGVAPPGRVTNADLAARVDTTDEWIVARTGIRERRVAGSGESTATLAVAAGRAALADADVDPREIDLLVVATATPEQPVPHTGARVGDALGLRCGSFDLAAGCAGFVYGLVVATGLVRAATATRVLLVGAETLSRIVDPDDRATAILFGDGAGAVVIAPTGADHGLLAADLGCDGSLAELLEVPAGGSRLPASVETVAAGQHHLRMQGREVFRRAVRAVEESARSTLTRAGVPSSDVDWFVPHQANARIVDAAAQRLGIPPERTIVNLDRYGNTSAASIPLALAEARTDGRIGAGDLVLLAGFGAGMTWASALVRWSAG